MASHVGRSIALDVYVQRASRCRHRRFREHNVRELRAELHLALEPESAREIVGTRRVAGATSGEQRRQRQREHREAHAHT